MLIDTHCHLDFNRFDQDRAGVVSRAEAVGVTRIIVPAIDIHNCAKVVALSERYDTVYAAVGIHPNSSAGWTDSWLGVLRDLARHPKVIAIGEIGLDYYWDKSPKKIQHRAFSAQLELAAELGLPVIVHNRESDEDVVALLGASSLGGSRPGVLHSFSTSYDIAKQVLDQGYYLGFTGPVTYKKADGLRSVASRVPLDRILVETDAPFLAPQKYRGKRNEPAYVVKVAERLASLHNMSYEAMVVQTTANAERLFGL